MDPLPNGHSEKGEKRNPDPLSHIFYIDPMRIPEGLGL